MKVYTSYYSKVRGLDTSKFCLVSISRSCPSDFTGFRCGFLCPSLSILNEYKYGGGSVERYVQRFYNEVLYTLKGWDVLEWLYRLGGGRDVVLCCYEGRSKFCHRHLVSKFLMDDTGYLVEEL